MSYHNDFAKEEEFARTYLVPNSPAILRIDGKNITKHHDVINLLHSDFTKQIFDASDLADYAPIRRFAILDEVSVCLDSRILQKKFDDLNITYVSNVIAQDFLKQIWEYYPDTRFGVSLFSISTGKVNKYFANRKEMGTETALIYFAKEYMQKSDYHQENKKEIEENLVKYGLEAEYNKAKENGFFSGISSMPDIPLL